MKYDQLSNTLTFVKRRRNEPKLLERLVKELKAAQGVPNFQVIGPWTSKFRRRKIVKLVFSTSDGAAIALQWVKDNFQIR